MLTPEDIQFIKDNRREITANRTVTITAQRVTQSGKHPITGEPIETTEPVTFEVVLKDIDSLRSGERSTVEGIELQSDDILVTFFADADLTNITDFEYKGKTYRFVAIDERGIGQTNRFEVIARLVR